MMKHKTLKTCNILAGLTMTVALGVAGTAQATKYEFHGDMDHRFLVHTDQIGLPNNGVLIDSSKNERLANFKYRLWSTMATDDDAVKGVFAIEVGNVRFGRPNTLPAGAGQGGAFSGDGVNIETRWGYIDLGAGPGRLKIGLQPYSLNRHLWKETAAGIQYAGKTDGGGKYSFAWMRGDESFNDERGVSDDLDALSGKYDWKVGDTKLGVFGLFQQSKDTDDGSTIDCRQTANRRGARCYEVKNFTRGGADFSMSAVGFNGTVPAGSLFVNWDVIAQTGSVDNTTFNGQAARDFDLSGTSIRLEVGKKGETSWKVTLLQQSGDDDPLDDDFDAFMSVDVDASDSVILGEESLTSDIFLAETNYLFDKGATMLRFDIGRQFSKKLWVGGNIAALGLAEDVVYVDDAGITQREDDLGVEIGGRVKWKFAPRTVFEGQLSFLSAGDAMDIFEGQGVAGAPPQDGKSDEDVVKLNARVRYKF